MDENQTFEPEIVEPPEAAVPEVEVAPVTAPTESTMKLDTFLRLSGRKPDQARGFGNWAKARGYVKRSMSEWETDWAQFMARPIR